MSYQVLARKWRPRTFPQMVGQEHVLRALINALDNNRLHHAYLFSGTRGVGKTTTARIFAKSLNCEKGISANPCGECGACQEIDQGRFIDLIEVDAASNTKVEDTRNLLENVQYLPTRGRLKVYLIDEVHMLSGHSFNALLKTLEEPPSHVIFLLATTDPQRLPVTVLSRCLQFHLKNMLPEAIEAHLKFVLEQEGIAFEPAALTSLAFAANGSMRDALSLLDQAIAYNGGTVTTAGTTTMLGNVDQTFIFEILDALANSNAKHLLDISAQLAEQGADFMTVLEELLSSLHKIAVAQVIPSSASNAADANSNAIVTLATRLPPEDIQLYYQITLIGRRDLPLAPSARMGFEIVLLRLLAFKPAETSSKSAAIPPSTAQSSIPNRTTTAPTASTQQAAVKPPMNITTATTTYSSAATGVTSAAHTTSASVSSTSSEWEVIIKKMNITGLTLSLANHCCLLSIENDCINLELDPIQAALLTANSRERLNQAFNQYFSKDIKLNIQTGEKGATSSPAGIVKKMQMEKQQAAIQTLENDANVQSLLKTFNATIQPESIKSGVE